jgi:hypothetical protein
MNMAKYFKILLAILILGAGCKKDFLDINKDPNYPTSAPLGQLLTNVEVDLAGSLSIRYGFSNFAAVYMHQITVREDPDQYGVTGTSYYTNNPWGLMYAGPLQDIDLMIKTGTTNGDLIYTGIAKILKAYSFSLLVDIYADVPFTEANKQTEGNPYPAYDKGEAIYPALFTLLDEAIENLSDANATNLFVPGDDDLIYGGDVAKWIRLANTIKLKLYTQIRLTEDVSAEVNALLTEGNLIGSGESFELPYGTSKSPDNRNPGVLEYEAGQKGYYISPWFYQLLKGYNPALFEGIEDPRIPYYFYQQLKPGQSTREGNPTEYRDGGFVSIYFGSIGPNRDHSTDGSMTVMGMYPVGGRYDQGDGTKVSGTSCTGAAPYRFLTYADRLYLEAELVNTGVAAAGDEREILLSAINESFSQVDHVVSLTQTTQTVPALVGSDAVNEYIDFIMSKYDAATSDDQKLEIIMTQKWIQSFGSNVDQWTDYRRTGYPVIFDPKNNVQAPGGFVTSPDGPNPGESPIPIPVQRVNEIPLSLSWGQDDLSINPNAPAQKNPATYKVFWDN